MGVLLSAGAEDQLAAGQTTIDDLGLPLSAATFVVVDLETTGGSPAAGAEITEVGAVKVRGGEVQGEFQTFVRPTTSIPAFISVLTGITDQMVADAPRVDTVLPAFLEFARGAILVAHNAPFDIGFLRAAASSLALPWPGFTVLDTVRIARRALTRDEAPNCKLGTLARLFRSGTTPCHRALDDARATVDVLHGLAERVGNLGVHSVEDLAEWQSSVTPAQRRNRHLARDVPALPGVYVFTGPREETLYVGKSRNMYTRVRSYFTASETRRRMAEMVGIATEVVPIVCATDLEAEVRELRLIAERAPRYNRRSRNPEREVWVKLTVEPFPRLSIVREVRDDATTYLGPFPSRARAQSVIDVLHETVPLRQCTRRLSASRPSAACVLAELGRCGAPCTGAQSVQDYARVVDEVRETVRADPGPVVARARARLETLAAGERFEEAALARDRLSALLRALAAGQRSSALAALPELSAAQPHRDGGWDLHVLRYGRLVGSAHAPRGTDPRPVLAATQATAESVTAPPPPRSAALAEETRCALRWLDAPGTRVVEVQGEWTLPSRGAARFLSFTEDADAARGAADPFGDRGGSRPTAPAGSTGPATHRRTHRGG